MITTESSNANALRMAKLLIQNKLAACVSIKQIFSIYKWDAVSYTNLLDHEK